MGETNLGLLVVGAALVVIFMLDWAFNLLLVPLIGAILNENSVQISSITFLGITVTGLSDGLFVVIGIILIIWALK